MFIRPYAQTGPRRGKRGEDKRHKRHEEQRQRQNQEAEAEAKGTGREARGKPPGPARTYTNKNFPVPWVDVGLRFVQRMLFPEEIYIVGMCGKASNTSKRAWSNNVSTLPQDAVEEIGNLNTSAITRCLIC